MQLKLVGAGYAAIILVAAALLYVRHLQELRYPDEASGGMWAAGDAFLYVFIAFLFLIPTAFLIWIIAKFESVYRTYAQVLLGFSLSSPVCLGMLTLGENHLAPGVSILFIFRLIFSPFVLVGIGISWVAARFDRAKRLVSYALAIEALTLAAAVAVLIHAFAGAKGH